MDKKSLDIIVEEFFDTGKLILKESNLWKVGELKKLLKKIRQTEKEVSDSPFDTNSKEYIHREVLKLWDTIPVGLRRSELDWFNPEISQRILKTIESKKNNRIKQLISNISNKEDMIENLEEIIHNSKYDFNTKLEEVIKLIKNEPKYGKLGFYYIRVLHAYENEKNKEYSMALGGYKSALDILEELLAYGWINQKGDVWLGEELESDIASLKGEYLTTDNGLPIFNKGQIILEEDLFWIDLLKKEFFKKEGEHYKTKTKNIFVEEVVDEIGGKNYIYTGDNINELDWNDIFCTEGNYRRYKNLIKKHNITCDIFKGKPKFYNLKLNQKVKFKNNIKLTKEETEYINCAEKIEIESNDNNLKSKTFILKIKDFVEEDRKGEKFYNKVNLEYDYGMEFSDRSTYGDCKNKGIIEHVLMEKLEPVNIEDVDTYYGAQHQRRNIYTSTSEKTNDKLDLNDSFYLIINDLFMEFVANLQRLGIEPGDIDLRRKALINTPNPKKRSGKELKWINFINPKKNDDKVINLYEKLKYKIFNDATTSQVKDIIPYLYEINNKLSEQNKIQTTKIVEFINDIDFNNPENLNNTFKKIIKTLSSQYEEYWKSETKYFVGESDSTGSQGLMDTATNIKEAFNKSIMRIMDIGEDFTYCSREIVINDDIMSKEVDNLYGMVNVDNFQDKFDIKCIRPIPYNNNILIKRKDYLDVKKIKLNDSYLTELSTPFKSSSFGKEYVDGTQIKKKDCRNYVKIYNNLIDHLINKMNKGGQLKQIKDNILSEPNQFTGLIIEDNIYVPLSSIDLYWSNKGWGNDHRITLRYRINGPTYKLNFTPKECGVECDSQTVTVELIDRSNTTPLKSHDSDIFTPTLSISEDINPVEESITNFFDTGNFEF